MSAGRRTVIPLDKTSPEELAAFVAKLGQEGFYGTLVLTMKAGEVVNVQVTQSMAPKDVRESR